MKFLAALAFLLPLSLLGASPSASSTAIIVGSLVINPTATPVASYLLEEDCETGSTPSGWTDSGSVAWNYATSPAPLAGNYSFMAVGTANSAVKSYTANATVYTYCIIAITNLTGSPFVFYLRDSTDANVMRVRAMSDGTVRAYSSGSTFGSSSAGVVTQGSPFHIWAQYTKGTGANAISRVWVSSTSTKPGSVTVEKTDGAATANASKFYINPAGATSDIIIDKIRVSTNSIGSNPT